MKRRKNIFVLPVYLLQKVNSFSLAIKFLLIISCIFIILPVQTKATHIGGADMSYKWISGNTFEITLTLYRDCSGIAAPNSVNVNYNSVSCGYNLNVTLNKIAGTGQEITQPCDSSATNCTGGTNPGIQKYEYSATVTLPAQCSDWVFSYSICCRNCAITTLSYTPNNCSGVPATYIEATLNNLNASNNSSPVFTNVPVSFFCIGQEFHYNHGAYDSDGDSLVYSFITPRASASNNVVFSGGYSASGPISSSPPISLNMNGDIVMNPTAIEVGVMAILVKEYRNGILIGTVVRDMEIWIYPCSNSLPVASGINGSNNFSLTTCPGVPLTFTINSNDSNATQTVSMDWNHGIPWANFTSTNTSRPTGTFSWTPSAADVRTLPYTFTVTVQDNNCPSNGFQTYSYSIFVKEPTASVTVTNSNCANPGTGIALAVPVGNAPFQYAWSPGGETTASINNLVPGNYSVTITDANGCTINSPLTITSPPALSASVLATGNATCNGAQNGFLTVLAFGGVTPYTYTWSPSGGTNVTATGLAAGTYTCTISDANSCTKTVSSVINEPPALSASTSGSALLCHGGSNGFASVTPSGGTAPYSYIWSTGATTSTVNGLNARTYSVIITDARGCTISKSVIVSEPTAISGGILSAIPVSCYGGNDGAGQITVSGGSIPYSYSWFPSGDTGSGATGLVADNYLVTITDANNCITTVPLTITQPSLLSASVINFSDVLCHGDSNGFADVSVSGGTAPYFYNWIQTGDTSSTVAGLAAGNYSVEVTDDNGCSAVASIAIGQPAQLSVNIPSVTNVTCFNGSDGSASVSCSGGTPPFSFIWPALGVTSPFVSNLTEGIYSVIATDANGCSATVSVLISQPDSINALVNSTITTCYNGNDGTATVAASGGNAPYTYSWAPGGSATATITGLSPGIYNVTITDANGCTNTENISVGQAAEIDLIPTSTNSTCGMSNGTVTVSVNGGTPAYSYTWSPGNSHNDSLINISAGTYTVNVTDLNGCTASTLTAVSNNGAPTITLTSLTPVSCPGGNDGAASIAPSGGFAPFRYLWLPYGGTGQSATGLSAGSYSVRVTNRHNCSSVMIIDIPEPPAVQINTSSTSVTCFGGNNGNVSVSVSGGQGPFTYLWNPVIGNTAAVSGLSTGVYTVTVSDSNGCTFSSAVTVDEPALINATMNYPTAISCYGTNDGIAIVNVNGGTPPYSYNWNTIGSNTQSISGLIAGSYPVTITDSAGCTATSAAIINQPAELTVQTTITNGTCNIPNGSASLNITGGTSPFTYLWSQTGDTTSVVSGLAAGQYSVTVTDNNGCKVTAFADVLNSGLLDVTLSAVTPVSCFGGNNGHALLSVTNGTLPYSYNWQPSGGNNQNADSLSAGNYNVIVTDANNCTQNFTVVINEPPALSATVITTPVTCQGAGNGTATTFAAGGTGNYTYRWLPGGMNTPSAGMLNGGNYSVEVTDGNGCNTITSITINEPLPLNISSNTNPAGCALSNGSASVNVSGGTPPFRYLWNIPASQSATVTNIAAGSYSVIVTDSNNCTSSTSVSVSNTSGPIATLMQVTPVSCHTGADGSADIIVTSGVPPYLYNWTPYGGSSSFASNLSAGNYSVTIRDSNNCFTTIPVQVNESTQITAVISPEPANCFGGSDGSAIAAISGGTPPYTFLWSSGDSTATAMGLSKGTYTLTVTDANNCPATFSTVIGEAPEIKLDVYTTPVSCNGRKDGFGEVIATGGTPGYSYLWSNGSTYSSVMDFFAGNYTLSITDAHGCTVDTSFNISEPPDLILHSTSTDISCPHLSDGSANVNVTGGTPSYTYTWHPTGGNGPGAIHLPEGDYDVIVLDGNGCMQKIHINIGSPPPITVVTNSSDVKCFGANNGAANVTAYGGTSPYSYFWSTGGTTQSVANLLAGSYSVIITDDHACTRQATININQPTPLELNLNSPAPICIGQNAILRVTCTGGTPPFQYNWNNGSHNNEQTVSPAVTTTYNITVTDAHGCTTNPAYVTVTVHSALQALAVGPDTICEGSSAILMANGSGGNGGPYVYTWNTGETSNTITPTLSVSSIYTVTVSDYCGTPPLSVTVPVIVNPNPVVNFLPNPAIGCQPLLVNFSDQTNTDGNEFYWTFGDGSSDTARNPSHEYLEEGNYTVNLLVKTSLGCTGRIMVPAAVKVYPLPFADFTNVPEISSVYNPIITFFDESTNAVKWEWDFGDNSPLQQIKNTEHTYKDTGSFAVKLIATSDMGCIDTAYGKVIIKGEFAFYIPNAFTPNNDGVNDFFMPLGIGVNEFEMSVYDRWGLNIFNSSEITNGWNGRHMNSGEPCQMDVYIYKITISDLQGKVHNYVGRVSLVR